jgi:hypothetical protein
LIKLKRERLSERSRGMVEAREKKKVEEGVVGGATDKDHDLK